MQPRQTRIGRQLVGYGMATSTYGAGRNSSSARVQLEVNGNVKVLTASVDIGTGTYTVVAQTAADALGVPIESIKVEIGDSHPPPPAPISGGSQTTASIHPAILAAGEQLREDLLQLAIADIRSALDTRKPEESRLPMRHSSSKQIFDSSIPTPTSCAATTKQ